jgi:hypothetical protein
MTWLCTFASAWALALETSVWAAADDSVEPRTPPEERGVGVALATELVGSLGLEVNSTYAAPTDARMNFTWASAATLALAAPIGLTAASSLRRELAGAEGATFVDAIISVETHRVALGITLEGAAAWPPEPRRLVASLTLGP